jgi:ATP-dependent DNA helicase RecG
MGAAEQISKKKLGRLKSLGLQTAWQAAFLLPVKYQDFRAPLTDFTTSRLPEGSLCIKGKVKFEPSVSYKNGAPMLSGSLIDPAGHTFRFSKFGDTRDLKKYLLSAKENDSDVLLSGDLSLFNGKWYLNNVQIVNPFWEGKIRPVYQGKPNVINPDTVRVKVLECLFDKNNMQTASQWLSESLASFGSPKTLAKIAKCPGWTLNQIIWQSHFPKTPQSCRQAVYGLERLAGLGVLRQAQQNAPQIVPGFHIEKNKAADSYLSRSGGLPFKLTDEQKNAIGDSIKDLMGPIAGKRLLSGDVGTGKTAVYGMTAAICADQGGTVAIMLPNTVLAQQVGREIHSYWPDIDMQIITGDTDRLKEGVQIYIGTTALLHRTNGQKFGLVIIDEQHKFSREQREKLVQQGTHLLEVSATCIPRSLALMKFGFQKTSTLSECHVKKHIDTKIRTIEDRAELFQDIKSTLDGGGQVLVVYPKKIDDPDSSSMLPAVEEALPAWERIFPGQVGMVHSGTPSDQKEQIVKEITEGKKNILLSTTVVEVGLNIPRLRRVTIMNAERHGLAGLHQLRGRAARQGGLGHCDLYLPVPAAEVKDKIRERLDILTKTNDGFKIAEYDLKLRGAGDLSKSSEKQSGADETFLFGRGVRMDILEDLVNEMGINGNTTMPVKHQIDEDEDADYRPRM